jgi:hypothetical protein
MSGNATYQDLGLVELLYTLGLMTVHIAPTTSPYQRPFRIIGWSAIVLLLGIFIFSIYEPVGVSQSTNVALPYVMGVIVLGAVGYGFAVFSKEAMWKVKQGFRWELTEEKLLQTDKDGAKAYIALNEVKSLHEYHGWLFVGGGEPLRTIAIPADLYGFEQIKHELTARCSLEPLKVKVSPIRYLPHILGLLSLLSVIFSHVPAVVLISAATLILVQVWAFKSFRRIWRATPMPTLVLSSCVLTWLILAWLIFQHVKSVI